MIDNQQPGEQQVKLQAAGLYLEPSTNLLLPHDFSQYGQIPVMEPLSFPPSEVIISSNYHEKGSNQPRLVNVIYGAPLPPDRIPSREHDARWYESEEEAQRLELLPNNNY